MSREILIRTPNHLGDCVMALPMINQVHEAYPDSIITLLVPENLRELFAMNPSVEKLIGMPKDHVHGLIGVKKTVDLLSRQSYDIGYILPPSFGSAAAFKLAGVKERIGYIADGRRMLLSKPLALSVDYESEHRSETYFNLLRRGAEVSLEYARPKIFLSEDESERAIKILSDFSLAGDQPYAVIASRAVAESRRWGEANYASLAARLIKDCQLAVVLIGGPDDQGAGSEVSRLVVENGVREKWVINLAGKTSLRETTAVLQRSAVFVGNDSGPAHLAAAVGTPVVVLSGADNPKETSPLASRKRLIFRDNLDCISCVKNVCPFKDGRSMRCMREITLPTVFQAVKELLSEW